MTAAEFDLSEYDLLPPLDDADLPPAPPDQLELDALNDTELVDVLVALQRKQSELAAREAGVLALIAVRDSSDAHWLTEEVAAVMRTSSGTARNRLALAEQLALRLPRTLKALQDGELSPGHAQALTQGSFQLPDELLPAYEDRLLHRAGDQSLIGLRRAIRRAVIGLDPATEEQRTARARDDRRVRFVEADHGMAWLYALLPAADAKAIYARIDGAARLAPADDTRTMDQLRADALVNGVLNGITGELATEHGRQPSINVLVNLSTLTGLDDEPAWLDRYGPITADTARRIAHDPTGTWRRLITDPVTGQLLDYGQSRYRPPRHLADHVIAGDGQCSFPSVRMPRDSPTSITSSPTRMDRPARTTFSRCIDATTMPRPRPAGTKTGTPIPVRPPGSAHNAGSTSADRLIDGTGPTTHPTERTRLVGWRRSHSDYSLS